MDIIRNKLQDFLNIQPATKQSINIIEPYTFETNCLKNLLWYRGDSSELEQFYKQIQTTSADKLKFWASQSTKGLEIRKIHTGLPSLIIDTLTSIAVRDFNSIDFDNPQHENIWKDSQGFLRTDYSAEYGGRLGYITNDLYQNGKIDDNLIDKRGEYKPQRIPSRRYNKLVNDDKEPFVVPS